ncbi:MAG: FHA domain-containing protein, partial [Planctomycetota bacterium]
MPTALHVRSGPDKGRIFTLDPDRRLHIGRAVNCEVQLTDPVSSRFHAVVYFEDDQWFVHDTGSSNGTQVNGQKIDTAQLVDETIMVIGTTTLQFRRRAEAGETDIDSQNQTIFMDRKMSGVQRDPGLLQAFTSGEGDQADLPVSTQHLLDLLLLSFKLHRTDRVDDCIDTAMQMLHAQTNADVVGFLYDSGNGKLTPERFSPPLSPNESMQLSAKLTHRVTRYGEAIWVNDHGVNSDSAEHVADQARMESQHHHWTDAICVPMMAPLGSDASGNSLGVKDSSGKKPQPSAADIANADSRPVGPQVELDDLEETDGGERSESLVGILHLYRRSKSFTQEAFDFAVTAGSLLGLALARVRRMQSLQAEHQRISDRNAVSDDMIGDSKPMLKLKERILRV